MATDLCVLQTDPRGNVTGFCVFSTGSNNAENVYSPQNYTLATNGYLMSFSDFNSYSTVPDKHK